MKPVLLADLEAHAPPTRPGAREQYQIATSLPLTAEVRRMLLAWAAGRRA